MAGLNECAPSGDGGPATSAGLCRTTNLAVGQAGNLFVADMYTNYDCYFCPTFQAVRKISPSGIIATVAGSNCLLNDMPGGDCYKTPGYGATAAQTLFWGPLGLAVDTAGSLVVADDSAVRRALARRLAPTSRSCHRMEQSPVLRATAR
jgi:hypothetical protein